MPARVARARASARRTSPPRAVHRACVRIPRIREARGAAPWQGIGARRRTDCLTPRSTVPGSTHLHAAAPPASTAVSISSPHTTHVHASARAVVSMACSSGIHRLAMLRSEPKCSTRARHCDDRQSPCNAVPPVEGHVRARAPVVARVGTRPARGPRPGDPVRGSHAERRSGFDRRSPARERSCDPPRNATGRGVPGPDGQSDRTIGRVPAPGRHPALEFERTQMGLPMSRIAFRHAGCRARRTGVQCTTGGRSRCTRRGRRNERAFRAAYGAQLIGRTRRR